MAENLSHAFLLNLTEPVIRFFVARFALDGQFCPSRVLWAALQGTVPSSAKGNLGSWHRHHMHQTATLSSPCSSSLLRRCGLRYCRPSVQSIMGCSSLPTVAEGEPLP